MQSYRYQLIKVYRFLKKPSCTCNQPLIETADERRPIWAHFHYSFICQFLEHLNCYKLNSYGTFPTYYVAVQHDLLCEQEFFRDHLTLEHLKERLSNDETLPVSISPKNQVISTKKFQKNQHNPILLDSSNNQQIMNPHSRSHA